ncbi:TBC1 domain family member 25-like isoform X1 [Centruroides sculpturatus]|uniref:TBC1 domain family member 25-like isoform X1 n=2 Tax=Centruroides sculpturatus TaxID=218467 RepID=UPI000C6E0ED3|nr:TBC1 domain family member 25-like isoform X1 [Centruroides sculpturatus]
MSGILGYHVGEAIRVRVQMSPHVERKFSVDPEITSFDMLQSLLAKIYDIEGDFNISYMMGNSEYLPLASDWDLDAAFAAASHPFLQLRIETLPRDKALDEWDIIAPIDVPFLSSDSGLKSSLANSFLNQMEKTFTFLQKAFHLNDNNPGANQKNPMNNTEFHTYFDSDGRLIRPKELRLSVYQGGIEPSLRSVVWKHILNVYSENLSQSEQLAYLARKNEEYEKLRDSWTRLQDHLTDEAKRLSNNVWKDVLRTDRTHKFYSGSDNKNLTSLFNILTTYALTHPSVSYCQGMSDIVSPLLVVMKHEGHTYLCFCSLMERLKSNFDHDGRSMMLKFNHLSLLLQHYDPEFHRYLKKQGATDLIFCYRWLLLELKREFAFDDALHMLEVLWSSLPPSSRTEVSLSEVDDFSLSLTIDERSRHSSGYETAVESSGNSNDSNNSSDALWKEHFCESQCTVLDSDERNHVTNCLATHSCDCLLEGVRRRRFSLDHCLRNDLSSSGRYDDYFNTYPPTSKASEGYISEEESNSGDYTLLEEKCAFIDSGMTDLSCRDRFTLPDPQDLAGGNPFLLFLCLTILLQHRDVIIAKQMDYNDMAMHFDKLVRKHNVQRVLSKARSLFAEYLKSRWQENSDDYTIWNIRS